MREVHVPGVPGRVAGRGMAMSLAAGLLVAGMAGASSAAGPSGETSDFEFGFKDRVKAAVVCAYATGTDPLELDSFRVRGPRVQWPDSHPLPEGTVGWRVIVRSAPTRNGPWTVRRKTATRNIVAKKDVNRSFKARSVGWSSLPDKAFVRLTSKLIWRNEDGGVMGWVRHTYERYGLAETSGGAPGFDGHPTRKRDCPSVRGS
jgi:hypothetical protein